MSEAPNLVVADRYELKSVVGRGGYGIVYRAFDRRTSKTVAVKVLAPGAARDPSVVERMVREQQAMVALAGTRAVSAIDLCRMDSGALCLVMEWLEGEDLEQHLSRLEGNGERMQALRVLEIVGALADTLGKAHEMGIIHRDLKPANVFLMSNEPGGVRLLDFGLSRMKTAATLTAVGTVMGSPSYIAPETWGGNSKLLDGRADVYSLGVIAFRALGGQVPFRADSLVELLQLVTGAPRPSLRALRPDLPPAIDAWVEQALAVDPDRRFRSAHALYTALSEALGVGIPGEQPAPPADALRETRERVQQALESAVQIARDLFKRLTRRSEPPAAKSEPPAAKSEPPATKSEPPPVMRGPLPPIPVPPQPKPRAPLTVADQKSFIAEWLAGTDLDLRASDDRNEDVVEWLKGASAQHTGDVPLQRAPQTADVPVQRAPRLATVRPFLERRAPAEQTTDAPSAETKQAPENEPPKATSKRKKRKRNG